MVVEAKDPNSPRADQSLPQLKYSSAYPFPTSPEACLAFQISSPPATISVMKSVPVHLSSSGWEALKAP